MNIEVFADRLQAVLPRAIETVTTLPGPIVVVALVFHGPTSDLEIWCCSESRSCDLYRQQEQDPDPMHLWDAYQFDGWVAADDYQRIVAPVWEEANAYALRLDEEDPPEGDDREVARAVTTRVAHALNARNAMPWARNLAASAVTYPAGPAREPENQYLLDASITDEQRRRLAASGYLWSDD
jgi:hypothetical protein